MMVLLLLLVVVVVRGGGQGDFQRHHGPNGRMGEVEEVTKYSLLSIKTLPKRLLLKKMI